MRWIVLVMMAAALGCGEQEDSPTPPCEGAECEEDIDECATDNGGCDPLTECTNTIETRICGACPTGYSGAGETACVDIDECATANGGCDALVTCSNTAGARTCSTCPTGYSGTGDTGCVDIDECSTANGGCDALTTCANTPGGRTCSACPSGFTGTGDTACVDIDECLVDHGNCDPLASCTNTPGGRTCGACPATHAGTGETGCIEPISCADDDLDALVAEGSHEVPVSAECGANPTRCCKDVFGVLGLYSPLAELVRVVPAYVQAVLLPFEGRIILDGIVSSPGVQLNFGAGMRRTFEAQYAEARAGSQIRTALVPSTTPQAPVRGRSKSSRAAKARSSSILGTWRITSTELWDQDSLDLIDEAFIHFGKEQLGELMIAVRADVDYRLETKDGTQRVEFSFEGDDEGDPCSGRGWATLDNDDVLRGRLYIHRGDDSAFEAVRVHGAPKKRGRRGGGG